MPDQELNQGFGVCKLEATAKVVAPMSWVEQGKVAQFSENVMAAVHSHNRRASEGDYVAVDFPDGVFRRRMDGFAGGVARLVGSRGAVAAVLEDTRMAQFRRRTVSAANLISDFQPREEGYCLVRSRRSKKLQPGELRRRIRRAERNGMSVEVLKAKLKEAEAMSNEERRLAADVRREVGIFLGQKPVMFERKKATSLSNLARVSTYGMSDPQEPVIFDQWIEDKVADQARKRRRKILFAQG